MRERAGYQCEACGTFGRGAYVRVVRDNTLGIPEEVMTGPANTVLLCGSCRSPGQRDAMRARGFIAVDADPRLTPMAVALGGNLAWFWRTEDGRRVSKPPPEGTFR